MSGTSLDGVDAVLAEFSDGVPRMVGSHYCPYPDLLREQILTLHQPGDNELHRGALLANALSREYAAAVSALLSANGNPAVAAIGCHGQTIRHRPENGYTIQLVNGALLAELTGLTTVTDFRSRDIAAGGEGAPLVPAFHGACFRHATTSRAIVNIGGIANVTYLPANGLVSGFDTGPGNLLMDAWVRRDSGQAYDKNGDWAVSGTVQSNLLEEMLVDTYFHRAPPKSTGRDYFNIEWLESFDIAKVAPRDLQATLSELTASTIAEAIKRYGEDANEVFVCGGGAHNGHLLQRLAARLPNRSVATTEALGMHPDWVEALAFAWLACCAVEGTPGNAPEVTGAKGPRVLGAIYPR